MKGILPGSHGELHQPALHPWQQGFNNKNKQYKRMKTIFKPEEDRGYKPSRDREQNAYSKNYGLRPLYKGHSKALRKTIYK